MDIFKKFLNVVRLGAGLFFSIVLFAAGILKFVQTATLSFAFMRAGVFAVPHILEEYGLAFMFFALVLIAIRFAFPEKLRDKIGYKELFISVILITAFSVSMSIWDSSITDKFTWQKYMPWVETSPSKSTYSVKDVDYSGDYIEINGYFAFLKNSFKDGNQVEIMQDDKLTDKIVVEVYYRGDDAELYISDLDNGTVYIDMWEKDWQDGLSVAETVDMYKYKVDIEYADRFALEKIVIRTAYPEKIDTSEISIR